LLLGELVCKLRRGSDSHLERDTPFRFERPVRERGQLSDLPVTVLVCSTTPHRHHTANGNAERAMSWGRTPGSRRAWRVRVRADLADPTRVSQESAQPQGEPG
jgi:hypothetical protein